VRVVFPVLEQIVRGYVGLVADRDERGEAEVELLRLFQDGQSQRSALTGEGDLPGRWKHR
jgi:hypothetical protein